MKNMDKDRFIRNLLTHEQFLEFTLKQSAVYNLSLTLGNSVATIY
jgi:hypothetical protein